MASALEGLYTAIAQLQHSPFTLYGTTYIMSREEGHGIVWQQPPSKELAAMELNQPAGMLTSIFKEVCKMCVMRLFTVRATKGWHNADIHA